MLPHAVSESSDKKGRETLVQYIIKATVSKERMIYDRENQKMIYTSKRGTVSYEPLRALKMSYITTITVQVSRDSRKICTALENQ